MTPADYKWLWCDDHTKVTDWFISVVDRHDYNLFYSSFINIANKIWMKSLDPRAKELDPFAMHVVDCLLEDSIPANTLLEVLKEYDSLMGGTKGDIKSNGLIRWTNEPPTMTPIEAGAQKLYKVIAATWRKCCRAGPTENEDMEDEESVDAEAFDDNDKSFSQLDIAIVGGKKIKREEDMD